MNKNIINKSENKINNIKIISNILNKTNKNNINNNNKNHINNKMNSSFKNNNKYNNNNNIINKKNNPHKILKNGYELDGFIDDDEEEINDEDHIKAKKYLKRIKKKLSRGRGENDFFDDKECEVANYDTIQREEEKTKLIGEKEDEEERKKERELKKKKHKNDDDDDEDEEEDEDFFL